MSENRKDRPIVLRLDSLATSAQRDWLRAAGVETPRFREHAELVVHHRHRVRSHLAGANRMIGGFSVLPDPVEQLVVIVEVDARCNFITGNVPHRGRCHDAPGDAHRFERHVAVELRTQEIEVDCRRCIR